MDDPNFLQNPKLDDEISSRIRSDIMELTSKYTDVAHTKKPFFPGKTLIPASGKVFGKLELQMLVSSSLDFWLTTGRFNAEFEKQLSRFLNIKHVITTNSGSSANLLAVSSLMSDQLGEKKLTPGDEVITLAAGFPTTVNPIFQNNLTPKFIDIDLPTYSALPENIGCVM